MLGSKKVAIEYNNFVLNKLARSLIKFVIECSLIMTIQKINIKNSELIRKRHKLHC